MQSGFSQDSHNFFSHVRERLEEAEVYLSQGLFEEARQIYQDIQQQLAATPREVSSDREASRRFLEKKLSLINRQEAEFHGHSPAQPEKPESEEPKDVAGYNRALALLDVGLFQEAIQEFGQAADLGYRPAECRSQMAEAYLRLGRQEEAVRVLEEGLQLPDLGPTQRLTLWEQLAAAHEAADAKARALEIYRSIAQVDSDHPVASRKIKSLQSDLQRYHLNLARLHLKNRQFHKAAQELNLLHGRFNVPLERLMPICREILQGDPANIESLKSLAERALTQGELAPAGECLEAVQEKRPREPWSTEKLISTYKKLIEAEPDNAEIRLKLARHFLRNGQVESAVAEYLEAILEDTPHKLTALNELGDALLKRRDYERLLELLGDALPWVESLEQTQETLTYYYLMGTTCEKKNQYEQAQNYFQRVAAIDPDHQAIRDKISTQTRSPLVSQGKALLGLQVDEGRQYQLQENIAADEFHQIYKVTEIPEGRIRTAKTLVDSLAERSQAREFIRRWCYELTTMENRNIARVLDVAEGQGRYYMIMEDFRSTLEDILAEKEHLPLAAAVRLARALLNALAYGHSHRATDESLRKIFHLTLNPRRILIDADPGRARITDIGLAYLAEIILGWNPDYKDRPAVEHPYMAPEQFSRSPARMPDKMKQAADLYTFGVIIYQVITGRLPFSGPSPEDFCKQHTEKYPVPPRVYLSSIPPKLDELILKCLHKDPKKRWRTPTEVDLALEKIDLNE